MVEIYNELIDKIADFNINLAEIEIISKLEK